MSTHWRWYSQPGLAGPHGGAARPVIMGRHGAVATAHWLASLTGLDVLREGGNAFDAAVAAAAVATVAEPFMSGIGGIGGAAVYHASSDTSSVLNFEGRAPDAGRSLEPEPDRTGGLAGARVPGVVAGWADLLDRYGTRKFGDLLKPAIGFARHGVPVSVLLSWVIESVAGIFGLDNNARSVFMPTGRAPFPGELLIQTQLAGTLETIALEGPRAFYKGPIAKDIVRACASGGGLITEDDLRAPGAEWQNPIRATYRGYDVQTMPPPMYSFQALETLLLLGGSDLERMEFLGTDHLHLLAEAIKKAKADRLANRPDPLVALSPANIAARQSEIDLMHASAGTGDEPRTAARAAAGAETTHLVVADAQGNLVSLTQTLGTHFGGAVIVGDTGMLLNNLFYRYRRPGLPLAPTVVFDRAGAPWMAVGTVGGYGIPQTVPQLITNVIDFGMNPQLAVESPRIRVFEGLRLMAEGRIPDVSLEGLKGRGHVCQVVGEWAYDADQCGRGHMVVRGSDGTLNAAADPRTDGCGLAL